MATTRMVFQYVSQGDNAVISAFDRIAASTERANAAIDKNNIASGNSSKALDDNARAADRNKSSQDGLLVSLEKNTKGFSAMWTAVVAAAPAALPAIGLVAAGIAGLGSIVGSTGAALGVFGLTAKSQFTALSTGYKQIQTLKEQAALAPAGSKQQAADYAKLALEQQKYAATFGPAAAGMNHLQDAWMSWKKATSGPTLSILAEGMNTLAAALPKLRPLFDTGAQAAQHFLDAIQSWVKTGGLDRAVTMLNDLAQKVFPYVETAMRNLAKIGGDLAPMFFDLGVKVAAAVAHITTAMATWAGNKGIDAMNSFMAYITKNGPAVWNLLKTLADAAVNIVKALAPMAPISLAIATALAQLIASAPPVVIQAAAVAFVAYSVGVRAIAIWAPIATVATKAWAAAQWLLNVALNANPIGLVVIAVAALAAGIYLLIHYHQQAAGIFTTVWHGLQAVVQAVWGVIRPILSALWTAMGGEQVTASWRSVAAFFQTTMSTIIGAFNSLKTYITGSFDTWWASNGAAIKAIWAGIWDAVVTTVRVVWAVISPIITVGMGVIRGAIQVGMGIIQAVWNGAWAGISAALKIAWDLIEGLFRLGISVVTASWNLFWAVLGNTLKVMWAAFEAVIKIAWDVIVGIFTVAINLLTGKWGAAWNAMYNMAVQVWNALKQFYQAWWSATQNIFNAGLTFITSILSGGWNAIRSTAENIFNNLKGWFDQWFGGLKQAFQTAVSGIRTIWNTLEAVAEAPVRFIIDTVYDQGIVGVVNAVGSLIGLHLNAIHPGGLAEGGKISKGTTETADDVLVRVSRGETIVSAAHSQQLAPLFSQIGVPGYAAGGSPWGDIWGAIKGGLLPGSGQIPSAQGLSSLADLTGDALAAAASKILNPLLNAVPTGGTALGAGLKKIPETIIKNLIAVLKATGGGGDIVADAKSWLHKIPYVWGGTAVPGGADCSGFVQTIYGRHGISAPRTSEAQGGWVKRSGPVPGGLAFYHSAAGGADPGHVAIVADANNVISQGGGVGPDMMGLHGMPLLWTGIPPGGFPAGTGGASGGGGGAGVQRWRTLALQAMQMVGLNPNLIGKVLTQMQTESGGAPNAINLTDSNAQAGHPSQGLMQVIPGTFALYHVAGTSNNILDPLANIAAGLNYAKNVYGPNLNGLGQGHGYASGSWDIPVTGPATIHKGEMILPADLAAAVRGELTSGGGSGHLERLVKQLIAVTASQGDQFARALDGAARRARAY